MKRILIILLAFSLSSVCTFAQLTDDVEAIDPTVALDSTLFGRSVFDVLPSNVRVSQPASVAGALEGHVRSNASKQFSGYRIRLFFDSAQTAREASLAAISKFAALCPDVPVFRTYSSPNFKVTAGNFRTRLEAEDFLERIKDAFPDAFVVRERFKYPSIGKVMAACDSTNVFVR